MIHDPICDTLEGCVCDALHDARVSERQRIVTAIRNHICPDPCPDDWCRALGWALTVVAGIHDG